VGALVALGIGVRLATSEAVHRVRPPQRDWAMDAGGYAFPSGHTTAATLAAGLLAWAVSRHLTDRRGRFAVWVLAVGYAGLVGWSRVWLGVHWPLDVLGGWVLGSSWLAGIAALVAVAPHRLRAWVDG
jgi:undecaprenyl-diphosphatase